MIPTQSNLRGERDGRETATAGGLGPSPREALPLWTGAKRLDPARPPQVPPETAAQVVRTRGRHQRAASPR